MAGLAAGYSRAMVNLDPLVGDTSDSDAVRPCITRAGVIS